MDKPETSPQIDPFSKKEGRKEELVNQPKCEGVRCIYGMADCSICSLQNPKDLRLDTEAAGIYLGGESSPIPPDTMSDWRFKGKGPSYIKLGERLIRYVVRDLDAYLEKGRVKI